MKITPKRKKILTILEKEKNPINAEKIYSLMPAGMMNLSTVYRALEILYINDLISRCIIDHVAYYHINKKVHSHYMICTICKRLFEIDCHIHEMIDEIEKSTHYVITQHELTFYGLCNNCKSA